MRRCVVAFTQAAVRPRPRRTLPAEVPGLRDFLRGQATSDALPPGPIDVGGLELPPYLEPARAGRRVYVQSFGCAMNESDSDIVRAVLQGAGFELADTDDAADVVLLNTCAIRDKAEARVWQRLEQLRAQRGPGQVVGVLGCMAERLKAELLEARKGALVDLVVGPDGYRSLPQLLAVTASKRQ